MTFFKLWKINVQDLDKIIAKNAIKHTFLWKWFFIFVWQYGHIQFLNLHFGHTLRYQLQFGHILCLLWQYGKPVTISTSQTVPLTPFQQPNTIFELFQDFSQVFTSHSKDSYTRLAASLH